MRYISETIRCLTQSSLIKLPNESHDLEALSKLMTLTSNDEIRKKFRLFSFSWTISRRSGKPKQNTKFKSNFHKTTDKKNSRKIFNCHTKLTLRWSLCLYVSFLRDFDIVCHHSYTAFILDRCIEIVMCTPSTQCKIECNLIWAISIHRVEFWLWYKLCKDCRSCFKHPLNCST